MYSSRRKPHEKGIAMKKRFLIFLCGILLTGCGIKNAPPATQPPVQTEPPVRTEAPTQPETLPLGVYRPNENADGVVRIEVQVEEVSEAVIAQMLVSLDVLSVGTEVNSLVQDGGQLTADFNAAFRTRLNSYGTAGEIVMLQSVVNTFLEAYGAESILLTVDGETLESGHAVYDSPLTFVE